MSRRAQILSRRKREREKDWACMQLEGGGRSAERKKERKSVWPTFSKADTETVL